MPDLPNTLPESFNIGHACTQPDRPGLTPDHAAITIDNPETGVQALSFRALDLQSNQFAHALASMGASKGSRILIWLPNCIEFPIAFFGTLKQASIAVPASALLSPHELAYLAKDSGAQTLVTTADKWAALVAAGTQLEGLRQFILITGPHLESDNQAFLPSIQSSSSPPHTTNPIKAFHFQTLLAARSSAPLEVNTSAHDPAYLVYTSGTTGQPKGVLHAHRALLGRLPAASHWFHYQDKNDRVLHSGKFNWTYVLGTGLMDPLFQGKSVVLYEGKVEAAIWPKLIAKHQCSIFIAVPSIYRQILQKTHFQAADVPSLKHCMCAGEHLSDEVLEAWSKRFKLDIYEAVGMSECSYYLSHHVGKAIRGGSAGFPQPGHRVALLNAHMQPVQVEEEGMLCIAENDPGLFLGYWQQAEETAKHFREGYFCTGDYAKYDADGYYWFLGRKDDIINSFGYRLSPLEIERALKANPEVLDCVVVAETPQPDKTIVVAYVIPRSEASTPHSLLVHARQRLAPYKVPKAIRFVSHFPRTANGKVIRTALRERTRHA